MQADYVVIGGGVAGLVAAIRLTELGRAPLIIESGSYPSHKICGEFLSASCLDTLKQWGIVPNLLAKVYFSTNHKRAAFLLPKAAGALSHSVLDPLLLEKAVSGGARIYTNCRLLNVQPAASAAHFHSLQLDSGQTVQAKQLIIATGRLPGLVQKAPAFRYMGIKAHFTGIPLKDALEMFFFKDAYLGIAPVSDSVCNVACLAKLSLVNQYATIEAFIAALTQQNKWLANYFSAARPIFDTWMTTKVPALGCKPMGHLPNAYLIGDAAGTIPPVTGNGLAMSVASGLMAAEYAFKKDTLGYKKAWRARFSRPICFAKMLHTLMLKPAGAHVAMQLATCFPWLFNQVYSKTR